MRKLLLILAGLGLAAAAIFAFRALSGSPDTGHGRLVVTQRTEPTSFNRIAVPQFGVELISRMTAGYLIRVDRKSGRLEPSLARSWTLAPDGRTYTLKLRDATFSDGVPFTAADVLFTFRALYDPKVGSAIASGMMVNGEPIAVRALDDRTITLTFPAPYGPGLAILDALPIVPRHKLEAALDAGTFVAAWGPDAPAGDFAFLGPFVIGERAAGQHVILQRNPRYWGRTPDGRALPLVDEIAIEFVPEQNAEMLRLENGSADIITDEIRPEDTAALERAAAEGKLQLVDAGVSVDPVGLWFNLVPGASGVKARPYVQQDAFRHAVSLAVDRDEVVKTVFLGAAEPIYTPVTRGHGAWFAADLPHPTFDAAKAKTLLAGLGLIDRNGDGTLEDTAGRAAGFSVLTRKGNTVLERTLANLQEQLRRVGLTVDVVAMDQTALIARYGNADFETIYYGAPVSSVDPTINADFWLSSGMFHFWHPGQTSPSTAWEADIDARMQQIAVESDMDARVRAFHEVQRLFIAEEPIVYFAAPTVRLALSARVRGAEPVVLQPQILWKPEYLSLAGPPR
jgi:peptide/nickel transport system substrate-binding protein